MVRTPEYLKKGAKIALVAPSCGCAGEPYLTRLKEAIRLLKEASYTVVEGPNIFRDDGIIASASPREQAEEFMRAYESDADAIISVGGGELMCEILPHVDFDRLSYLPPKWFMGFSDNTNLTFTLTTLCGVKTIYGPCAPQFCSMPFKMDCLDALKMLEGKKSFSGYPTWELTSLVTPENPLAPLNLTERKIIRAHGYSAPFSGTLLGGCLDCLVNICGTRFDGVRRFIETNEGGFIWFLEACDLNPLGIRRALFELREAGWFERASGFILGRHLCNDMNIGGVDKYRAAIDMLEGFNVPLLMDVDLGHLPPSLPIMTGGSATVSFEDGNIYFDYQ